MPLLPARHHRRSIRLRGYDYSQPGTYFVTMCIRNRECLFGRIADGVVVLNDFGEFAKTCWIDIPRHFTHVQTDEFVIMPNHIHGILVFRDSPVHPIAVGATDSVAPTITETENTGIEMKKRPNGPPPGSLGAVIGQFKSVVAKRINEMRKTPGISLWQRDFYDRIGRNEDELNRIRQYIRNNPVHWDADDENPARKQPRYVAMPNPQRQYL